MNNDPIDNLAQSFLVGLVICSTLSDGYILFQKYMNDKKFQKNIEYYSDVFNAVTSFGLNKHTESDDGSIIIDTQTQTLPEKNKLKETSENIEIIKEKNEVKETTITINENIEINKEKNELKETTENVGVPVQVENKIIRVEAEAEAETETKVEIEKKPKKEMTIEEEEERKRLKKKKREKERERERELEKQKELEKQIIKKHHKH